MNDKDENKSSYVSFIIGNEIFAIPVQNALEVMQMQDITYVPNAPDFIAGVVNFRGDILPVAESRIKFGLPCHTTEEKYVIIVLEMEQMGEKIRLGAQVDGVKDVLEINQSEIKEVPQKGSMYNTEYLQGMVKNKNGFIMLLDINKVFDLKEITALQ